MVTCTGSNESLSCDQVENSYTGSKKASILLTQFEILPEMPLYASIIAQSLHMTIIVNPTPASNINLSKLDYADILLPNKPEAKAMLDVEPKRKIDLFQVPEKLFSLMNISTVIVTANDLSIVGADI
jgi:sugar/nucleoside kinase (ribokinase family)